MKDKTKKQLITELDRMRQRVIELEQVEAESRRVAKDLVESETRFRLISEMTSDYASQLKINKLGELELDWNTEGFENLFGFSSKDLKKPSSWSKVVLPESVPVMEELIERTLAGGDCEAEVKLKSKNGDVKWISFSSRPWINENGKIIGIHGAGKEITLRKKAEQELRKTLDTLEKRVEERTENLNTIVNAMAGREVRMAELKTVIHKLRKQIIDAGMTPVANDPILDET